MRSGVPDGVRLRDRQEGPGPHRDPEAELIRHLTQVPAGLVRQGSPVESSGLDGPGPVRHRADAGEPEDRPPGPGGVAVLPPGPAGARIARWLADAGPGSGTSSSWPTGSRSTASGRRSSPEEGKVQVGGGQHSARLLNASHPMGRSCKRSTAPARSSPTSRSGSTGETTSSAGPGSSTTGSSTWASSPAATSSDTASRD